jgi:hypothetical protein
MSGLAASFLAGLAAIVGSQTGDVDIVPFFIGLSLMGGVEAWAAREPSEPWQTMVAKAVALVWLIAAVWVGVLLAWEAAYYGASRPPSEMPRTFLSVPVSAYHLLGLYGGAALVMWSAFGPAVGRRRRAAADR